MADTTTEFPIEKGIPIPTARKYGPNGKYPWPEMDVGDSFFRPGVKNAGFFGSQIKRLRREGKEFVTRTMDGGVRVWRMK